MSTANTTLSRRGFLAGGAAAGAAMGALASAPVAAQEAGGDAKECCGMDVLRTPDERFDGIEGFDYEVSYTEVAPTPDTAARIAHIEAGAPEGPTVLLLHGEPTWSYLYRNIIPPLAAAGYRVLAPDFVGFGRSDKPRDIRDITHERHVSWMTAWVQAMDLRDISLFGHDWGGMIGIRMAVADSDRYLGLAVCNSPALPCGDIEPPQQFKNFLNYAMTTPEFSASGIVDELSVEALPDAVRQAYDAPFPSQDYMAGPRAFPTLAPFWPGSPAIQPNLLAWQALARWTRPFLMITGSEDILTVPQQDIFIARIPGAREEDLTILDGLGHYVPEDDPEACTKLVMDLVGRAG